MKTKFTAKHTRLLIAIILALFAGLVNYFLFRPNIVLFRFLSFTHQPIHLSHKTAQVFFTCYFSDIMWGIALYTTALLLSYLKYLDLSGRMLILVLPFVIETAQFFTLIPGTFDWYDIVVFAVLAVVFIFPLLKLRI